MTDPLQQWFQRCLEWHGALTTFHEGAMEAVLPAGLALRTGWLEYERFSCDSRAGTRLVSLHSDVLDAIRPVVDEMPTATQVAVPATSWRRSGFEEIIRNGFGFANGVARYQGSLEQELPYLAVWFRAVAISEEKKEALFGLALNTVTGAPAPEIVDSIEARLDGCGGSPAPVQEGFDSTHLAPILARLAREHALGAFREFERSLGRRLARDIQRLVEYYGTLEREIHERIRRKHLTGEDAAREGSRIEAVRRELEFKLGDQRSRYALTIRIRPVNRVVALLPVTQIGLLLLRKKKTREVIWTFNQLSRGVELPHCEACAQPIRRIHLCDDNLHLLCATCSACPGCGRDRCAVCRPGGCPRCNDSAA